MKSKNLYLDTPLEKSGISKNPEKNRFLSRKTGYFFIAVEVYQEALPPKIWALNIHN